MKRGGGDRGRGRGTGEDGGGRGGPRGVGGGRGRGSGRGARAPRPRPSKFEEQDVVNSRPQKDALPSKKGKSGTTVALKVNYFKLHQGPKWSLFHYRVDFKPELDRTQEKKDLFAVHTAAVGSNIFDGHSLYVAHKLQPNPMTLYSSRNGSNEKIQLTIRLVDTLEPSDPMYLNFYNIIVRKCLGLMKLEEVGRHFYDDKAAIQIPQHKLELWPGYITSMRNHESDVLLCVEITHKIIRKETVLNVIDVIRKQAGPNFKRAILAELTKTIVMTKYNKRTYRIDDIVFDMTPKSTFDQKGNKVSYMDYYKSRYQFNISDTNQPLLVSLPKKKDIHRGITGPIYLIPELCHMTGLTEEQRKDNKLQQDLSSHFHMEPNKRLIHVSQFMNRLSKTSGVVKELDQWGVKFDQNLVELSGRTLPTETIQCGPSRAAPKTVANVPNFSGEWSKNLKTTKMLKSVTLELRKWVLMYSEECKVSVGGFLEKMKAVASTMNFVICDPVLRAIKSSHGGGHGQSAQNFVKVIDEILGLHRCRLQLMFIILPTNKLDFYSAIKRRCFLEYGVPSQCFLARNFNRPDKLEAITTKLAVQMNTKLGGEPWSIHVPTKSLMIMGFDVYHSGGGSGSSVGALVATTNNSCTTYYSCVSFHKSKNELSSNLCTDVAKALNAYKTKNTKLPDKIVMYRDGVGEGQLTYVYNTELLQIQSAIDSIYTIAKQEKPRFGFIIVTKRIHTRMFTAAPPSTNPAPGTVVDDIITLPERYDFYIVSQKARQGTVSPTAYNVLYNTLGYPPDVIQILTYKLCHLYFNWTGTVAVPAPCQYAHKLAYMTGKILHSACHESLASYLYYL